MEASLDQASSDVLHLLSCLNEKIVAGWNLYRDTIACVACPDMQAWESGATVNGEKVEVRVEPGKDSILYPILFKVRGSWCEEMRAVTELLVYCDGLVMVEVKPIAAGIAEVLSRKAEANRGHLGEFGDAVIRSKQR
jgi:hypothetical protein